MKLVLAILLSFVAVLAPAQTKVDDENYAKFFKGCEAKNCYLMYPGDGKKEKPVFLGNLTSSKYDSDSIASKYTTYGSKYETSSIWNKYGDFGGKYSTKSPWNEYSTDAIEIIYKEGKETFIVGYLTANKYFSGKYAVPNVDPKFLAYWLDRADDIP